MGKNRGFTLVEILIVVAIIGILASVILVGLSAFRSRGRDSRRLSDLHQAQNALELYFTKVGKYPNQSTWSGMASDITGAGIGVTQIPNDPTKDWTYGYCVVTDLSKYVIAAHLEDKENPALKQTYPASADPFGTCNNPALDSGGATTPEPAVNCSLPTAATSKFCMTL